MSIFEFLGFESNKKREQRIVFPIDSSRKTEVFNFNMDAKMEEYRRRMKYYTETEKDVENNEDYLDAKYKLYIGNAVRFNNGCAKYGEVFDSLKIQDLEINEDLFDNAWEVIANYVKGEESNLKNGSDFKKENGQEVAHILRIEIKIDEDGFYKVGEVYDESDGEKIEWQNTRIKEKGDKSGTEQENRKRVLEHIRSKYGRQKEIRLYGDRVGDEEKPFRYATDKYY